MAFPNSDTRDVTGTLIKAGVLLSNPKHYAAMANAVNPYGDGHASERIRQAILWYFKLSAVRPKAFAPRSKKS